MLHALPHAASKLINSKIISIEGGGEEEDDEARMLRVMRFLSECSAI
jgi:hypothetical protein